MKGLQLDIEEKQLLVESLLFTASCDVCSDHTPAHRKRMIDLAEKINDKNTKLYNIYVYETGVTEISDEPSIESILTKIPNIPKQTAIKD
jgi:hypothetical protein